MAAVNINRGSSGVALPASVAAEIWGLVAAESAVMRASRRIDLPGNGAQIDMITGLPTAAWVGESEEKPVSRPTLSNKVMTAYTLAVIVPFSDQFLRDKAALYRECIRLLPTALAQRFDSTVFGAVGTPGANFDSLATAPQMTVDATGTFGDVAAVVNAVAAAGGDLSSWIASPALHGLLLTTTDSLGRQIFVPGADTRTVGSVFGAPVVKSRAPFMMSTTVGDDTGIAGDFAGSAVYGTVEGVQLSFSNQATLTDGGSAINLWQRDMTAVRARIEVGFRVRDVNHFVRITDGVVDTP